MFALPHDAVAGGAEFQYLSLSRAADRSRPALNGMAGITTPSWPPERVMWRVGVLLWWFVVGGGLLDGVGGSGGVACLCWELAW